MGVPYELVIEWAQKSKQLNHMLQECRAVCAIHIRKKLTPNLRYDECQKYWAYLADVDDEFAKENAVELEHERSFREQERLKAEADKERRKGIILGISESASDKGDNTIVDEQLKKHLPNYWEKKTLIEDERLKTFFEKFAQETVPFTLKKNVDKSTDYTILLEQQFENPNLTRNEKSIKHVAAIFAATGTTSLNVGRILIDGVLDAIPRSSNGAKDTETVHEALRSMAPKDLHEGMLCSRIWILYNQAMRHMSYLQHPDISQGHFDRYSNYATKLMRLHDETLEALNRYRRKGEQKVIVQHVNVNDGGQAVVAGQFNHQREGARVRNQRSSPCQEQYAEQKHDKIATNYVNNQQCPTEDVDYMEEKVQDQEHQKVKKEVLKQI